MSSRTLAPIQSQALALPKLKPPKRMPMLAVGLFDRDGNLVRISEQADPRERLADLWNGSWSSSIGTVARPLSEREAKIARKLLAERTVAHA